MLQRLILFCLLSLAPLNAACALNIITYNTTIVPLWQMVSSQPGDNALLNGSLHAVTFTFSQNIDPAKSSIKIYDPYNNPVGNLPLAVNGFSMTSPLPKLLTGTYRVEWHADCLCKGLDALQGALHFTVQ